MGEQEDVELEIATDDDADAGPGPRDDGDEARLEHEEEREADLELDATPASRHASEPEPEPEPERVDDLTAVAADPGSEDRTAPAEARTLATHAEDGEGEDEEGQDEERAAPPAAAWPEARVEAAIEALLFASPDVLPLKALRRILPEDAVGTAQIRAALASLQQRYAGPGSGLVLLQVAGGWQIQTRDEQFTLVQALARTRTDEKVTQAALETLAIVAYKQPITRAEIDAIRGVGSGQIIRTLMDKKMVRVVGRVDLPGRPFQYGTTRQFLEQFALNSLDDLPKGRDL